MTTARWITACLLACLVTLAGPAVPGEAHASPPSERRPLDASHPEDAPSRGLPQAAGLGWCAAPPRLAGGTDPRPLQQLLPCMRRSCTAHCRRVRRRDCAGCPWSTLKLRTSPEWVWFQAAGKGSRPVQPRPHSRSP